MLALAGTRASRRRPARRGDAQAAPRQYRERIAVDGRPIARGRLRAPRRRPSWRSPTGSPDATASRPSSSSLTAVVFRHFAEADLDLALVEVGLGGRLDATHAWDGGVAAVTNVDLDHIERLGPTIAAIAREKAAIIERGDLAVTGATGDALEVIAPARATGRRAAHGRRAGAAARAGTATASRWSCPASARRGSVCAAGTRPPTWPSPTPSSTRWSAAGHRAASTPTRAGAGTPSAVWPGRLELLDLARRSRRAPRRRAQPGRRGRARRGARRPAAVPRGRARSTLRRWPSMADKDVDGVVAALGGARPLARRDGDRDRRRRAPRAARRGPRASAGGGRRRRYRASPSRTRLGPLDAAIAEPGATVVAGSLYLVGAVRAHLVDDPALRDPSRRRPSRPRSTER